MDIDWTKPVETDEENPRPVRIAFDSDGVPWFGVAGDDDRIPLYRIRNVVPKPVSYSTWVNLYADGFANAWPTKFDADEGALSNRVECRRIVWNSDGSPVYGMVSKEEYDRVCAELKATEESLKMSNLACAERKDQLSRDRRNVAELKRENAKMEAVIDAAVKCLSEVIDGIFERGIVKSCDNCANGPITSQKCLAKRCFSATGYDASFANWEPMR